MKKEPTLQDYIGVVMERRWLVGICVGVTTVAALETGVLFGDLHTPKSRSC